jgi:uncharacterized membrane protein
MMFDFKVDKESKEWRQFVTWIAATLVFPVIAYIFIRDITPDLEFSSGVILILIFIWALVSFFIHLFVKENVK